MNFQRALLLAITMFFIYLLGIAAAAPQGASIYVSTAGSDSSGDGSLSNPFRTIGHALTITVAGDEIVLRGAPALTDNVYAESIRIQQPNITIRSQTDEWAVIQCPVNDADIGQCVRFDVDSDGSRLQRVEVIGGYYYGIKLETKWDWGDPNDRSGASNILLEDIKVHDTGRDAIKITPGCDDVTIRRAEIFNTGVRDNSNAEGIDNVNGDRMIVQDSYLHDIATNGIYFKGGSTASIVERNRIERVGGAGILVGFDTSPEFFDLTANPDYYESIRGMVRDNIILDTQGAGIGLYAAKDAQIWNNTLIDTAQAYHSPIYFGITYQDWDPQAGRPPSINPVIRNNLVYQSSSLPTECVFIRYSNDLGGLSALSGMPAMDYNLYFHAGSSCLFTDQRPSSPLDHGAFSQWQAHISGESHSLTNAPQLTSDGHLSADSPAIDAGTCTGAPTDDFDGDHRPQGTACDIGADEFASGNPSSCTNTGAVFRIERTTGNACTDGSWNSGGGDVAEHILASELLEPGDVVEVDPHNPRQYRKVRSAYSLLIAGAISTQPGFALGLKLSEEPTPFPPSLEERSALLLSGVSISGVAMQRQGERALLALVGRVPVKVTTENGPIRPGDLLTSSFKPGYAMRCDDTPRCEGAILGKALEALAEGEGVILVLLMR